MRGRPVGSRGRPIGSRGCPQDPRRSRGHFHHTLIPSPFDDQGSGMKATTNLSKLHLLGSEASLQSPPTWNLINNNNKRILFMISSFFNQLYNSPYGRSPKPFFLDGVLKDMWVGEGEWYTFSKSYLPSILPGTFRNVSIWLHSSRSPGNMIEFTILNYIKRSSLVRTLSHIKASLPLPRGRVPEASSQQRSDMANPSKS